MSESEPPPPKRGQTAQERSSDATAPEQDLAAAQTMSKRFAAAVKPRFLFSQAEGYPVGIKQFLWFCLLLIYPAWIFFLLFSWVAYGVLWVVFSPLRLVMKRKDPEAYAASQRK
jgi:YggT family protein